MKYKSILSSLIIVLLIISSCAPPIRILMPNTKTDYPQSTKLVITTNDGQKHIVYFKESDDEGIHGFNFKFIRFEDIAFIETEKPNPANVGIALLGTAAIGTAVFLIAALSAQRSVYQGISDGLSRK